MELSSVSRASYTPSSNVSITTVQKLTDNKSIPNAGLDGLASLLADPSKISGKDNNEDAIKEKLTSINNEMDAMQAYLDQLNQDGAALMGTKDQILATLKGMSDRLNEIEQELQDLAAASKQRTNDGREQFDRLNQTSLLQTQIENQRKLLEGNKKDDAPAAPQAAQAGQEAVAPAQTA